MYAHNIFFSLNFQKILVKIFLHTPYISNFQKRPPPPKEIIFSGKNFFTPPTCFRKMPAVYRNKYKEKSRKYVRKKLQSSQKIFQ